MTYQPEEEESPCIHHRSHFDTIPAPPPTPGNAHILKDPVFILSRYGREKIGAHGRGFIAPPRNPSEPTMLSFVGGEVELPRPTRAELVLSAQQWATAVRECFVDEWVPECPSAAGSMLGKLDRLDAVLKELTDAAR